MCDAQSDYNQNKRQKKLLAFLFAFLLLLLSITNHISRQLVEVIWLSFFLFLSSSSLVIARGAKFNLDLRVSKQPK